MNMKFVSPEQAGNSEKDIISNAWFWPSLDLSLFRQEMRMDGTVTADRLRLVVKTAIAEVNAELYDYREKQHGRGYSSLSDVPSEEIDGESQRMMFYRNAVWCWARAVLVERYSDFDATGAGDKKADAMEPSIGELWRDARWAISRFRDLPHMTVELI